MTGESGCCLDTCCDILCFAADCRFSALEVGWGKFDGVQSLGEPSGNIFEAYCGAVTCFSRRRQNCSKQNKFFSFFFFFWVFWDCLPHVHVFLGLLCPFQWLMGLNKEESKSWIEIKGFKLWLMLLEWFVVSVKHQCAVLHVVNSGYQLFQQPIHQSISGLILTNSLPSSLCGSCYVVSRNAASGERFPQRWD